MKTYARHNRHEIKRKLLLLIEHMEADKEYTVHHPGTHTNITLTAEHIRREWLEYFNEKEIDTIMWDWVMVQANQIWKQLYIRDI